jgi:hypothetical protein
MIAEPGAIDVKPFVLSQEDREMIKRNDDQRVFIDGFKDVGEGRLYKGYYNKKTGHRDGLGIQFWPDGSKYEGMWSEDKAHGRGRMVHANGDFYEGDWRDDKANGFGVFVDSANARYEGEWVDDMQHGQGQETWDKGSACYRGTFVRGKKNGLGRFDWADGSYYEGNFVDG